MDRISILSIKIEKLSGDKKDIAKNELAKLDFTWDDLSNANPGILVHYHKLKHVNTCLWEVEDAIRESDADLFAGADDTLDISNYDPDKLHKFVKLARSVYELNDERYRIKNHIDTAFGGGSTEVKSYVE